MICVFTESFFVCFLEQGLEEMKKLLLLLLGCAVQVRAQFTVMLHSLHTHATTKLVYKTGNRFLVYYLILKLFHLKPGI